AAERSLAAAAQRLTDLQATTTGEAEPVDLPTAAALTGERQQVQQQLGALTAAQAKRAEFRSLVAEIEGLEVGETVAKALEKALQRVRAEEIERGAEPLLSIMREVLAGAGRAEIPFLLGWTNAAGEPVPVEVLSGSEFALYAAALAAAVIIRRGAPRRFLLVEAAEADAAALTQLMAGLGAVAERMTAVVVATPHEPARVPEGWVQIAPNGEHAAAVAA
ncbi:MAG: hypothetical protein SF182_07250, partial [Deltaproteobacteria bacterium]|nr:hypothetical protein [Deltaproteobacteria bacterium]